MKTTKNKTWTRWTQRRLEDLFQKYNRQYFNGSLSKWGASIGQLGHLHAIGFCESKKKQLLVDTDHITSDAEVRSTLLHEMAHAAAPAREFHGYNFWEQIELLLQKGAPITLGFPEAPNNKTFADIIPKKFRLCRKAMDELEVKRTKRVERYAKKRGLQTEVITDEAIIADFVQAAHELPPDYTESDAIAAVAKRYDLFDVGGNPKNAWAARVISEGKKAYRRAKKELEHDLAMPIE